MDLIMEEIKKYVALEDFISTQDILVLKGDEMYGVETIINGCTKTYVPWECIDLYSKNNRVKIGYINKANNLVIEI